MMHKGFTHGAASVLDKTLADYLARKQQPEKLSFEEWFKMRWHGPAPVGVNVAREIWNAAQENV